MLPAHMFSSIAKELYIHELSYLDPETGRATEARLDIVLWTAKFRALLDVRMFHMMVARGSTLAHEQLKHNRYPTRHSDGRRLVNGILCRWW